MRYQITPDPMRHLITGMLPKRTVDRIIAKRLGLTPRHKPRMPTTGKSLAELTQLADEALRSQPGCETARVPALGGLPGRLRPQLGNPRGRARRQFYQ